jgi:hypothetical protein
LAGIRFKKIGMQLDWQIVGDFLMCFKSHRFREVGVKFKDT